MNYIDITTLVIIKEILKKTKVITKSNHFSNGLSYEEIIHKNLTIYQKSFDEILNLINLEIQKNDHSNS